MVTTADDEPTEHRFDSFRLRGISTASPTNQASNKPPWTVRTDKADLLT